VSQALWWCRSQSMSCASISVRNCGVRHAGVPTSISIRAITYFEFLFQPSGSPDRRVSAQAPGRFSLRTRCDGSTPTSALSVASLRKPAPGIAKVELAPGRSLAPCSASIGTHGSVPAERGRSRSTTSVALRAWIRRARRDQVGHGRHGRPFAPTPCGSLHALAYIVIFFAPWQPKTDQDCSLTDLEGELITNRRTVVKPRPLQSPSRWPRSPSHGTFFPGDFAAGLPKLRPQPPLPRVRRLMLIFQEQPGREECVSKISSENGGSGRSTPWVCQR